MRIATIIISTLAITALAMLAACNSNSKPRIDTSDLQLQMQALYGVNRQLDTPPDTSLAAEAANGTFVGRLSDGVLCFKGIPYAVQPTGKLRWQVAQPEPDSRLVREAYYYGHAAVQPASNNAGALYPQGEDCLTLNVWTAQQGWRNARRPVMVWIHGGSYCLGSTADPAYDGERFVSDHPDVVMVSINYRLGLLGFLDLSQLPDGKDYAHSANLGLLDQVEALRWVKRNIAAWGGDPDNVTIMGQSAGGGSVALLTCIDEAQGLFKRAIMMSGSVALTSSREQCQQLTRRVLDHTGAKTVAQLVAMDDSAIVELVNDLGEYNRFPMRDGTLVPLDPYTRFDGANAMVDMMIGSTRDEARMWIDAMGGVVGYKAATTLWTSYIQHELDSTGRHQVDEYMAASPASLGWRATELLNDLMFRGPAIQMAQRHASAGGTTFMYLWDKPLRDPSYGACHASENAYVLDHPECQIKMGDDHSSLLAQQVQQMWVNFAATGDPSTPQHQWPRYDPTARMTMVLGDSIAVETDPMPRQRQLIEPLMGHYISPVFSDLLDRAPWILAALAAVVIAVVALVAWLVNRLRRLTHRNQHPQKQQEE